MSHSHPALRGNLVLLDQGLRLLEGLTDDQFGTPVGGRSPVGAQYRHVLEHYTCLLEGVEGGSVDYDSRAREEELERSVAAASARTREVAERVAALAQLPLSQPLRVHLAACADSPDPSATVPEACDDGDGTSPASEWYGSTLGRELLFVLSHTVHHFALIRFLLEAQDCTCEEDFGTAPSTIAHRAGAR